MEAMSLNVGIFASAFLGSVCGVGGLIVTLHLADKIQRARRMRAWRKEHP